MNSVLIERTPVGAVCHPGHVLGHIDIPQAGHADAYSFDLGGWLTGFESAVKHAEIHHASRLLRVAEVNLARPDVVEHLRGQEGIQSRMLENAARCGFVACVSVIGLPEQFELRADAVLEDGRRFPLGIITGRRRLLRPDVSPRLQPVTPFYIGRSGSTWLMHLLGSHPEIVMHLRYPLESPLALHTLRTVETLAQPSNPPTRADVLRFRDDRHHAASIPLYCRQEDARSHAWMRREYVERLAKWGLETVDAFYSDLAEAGSKADARFFAEKVPVLPGSAELFAELYPRLKDVFLVRDYRDVACSRRAFFDDINTFAGVVDDVAARLASLLDAWRVRKEHSHLLHYEKLVR
ncbi:MAG: sulfotransferase, partial [Verrucomicrobia bacterium]|nr:sulfotransferase [Verrucomicrobiota bacterium]